jgi:hypothetical protein
VKAPSERPPRVEVKDENIPTELQEREQWVCWKYVWNEGKGKWDKVPLNPKTGKMARSNNPKTWSDFKTAFARYKDDLEVAGIGFVVSPDDPFTGVDLDGCRDPVSEEIAPWAEGIISYLSSYTEVSPSGKGVRLFVKGKPPRGGKRDKKVEVYGGGQYLTVTGHRLNDRQIEDREEQITVIHSMLKAKLFSDEAFMRLLSRDDSDYDDDWSRGDLAFCGRLAKAGLSETAIDEVVRASSRFRGKWDEIHTSDGKTYGQMTLEKVREAHEEPSWFREMNDKYFVSRMGGKTGVFWEENDPELNRCTLQSSTFADFRNFYSNEIVLVGEDRRKKGHAWLDHPRRRQYDRIVLYPNGDPPAGCFNLWKGFAVNPKFGDWSLFLFHLEKVVCRGIKKYLQYLLGWLAYAVQHPERPGYVAVVLRGERGAGKGIVAQNVGALFGQHFLQIFSSKHLVGNFNAHLRDCIFLFVDEAFWAGDKRSEGILKGLVTEKMIQIEGKGKDVVAAPNMLHIMMATNNMWAIPAGPLERRFFVLDVGSNRVDNKPYFKAIMDQMESGGREALLYDLLNMDLSNFRITESPNTEALDHQKIYSMDAVQAYWYERLQEGTMPHYDQEEGFYYDDLWERVMKDRFYDDYVKRAGMAGIAHKGVKTTVALGLKKLLPDGYPKTSRRTDEKGNLKYWWEFPPLEECRAHFEKVMKMKCDWEDGTKPKRNRPRTKK